MTPALTRPLPNAHWALPVALVAAWVILLTEGRCLPNALLVDFTLGASTVCIAFWASHLRYRGNLPRIAGGALYDLLLLVALIVVIAVPLKMVMPLYSCSPPRAKVAEVIVYSQAYRKLIEEQAARQKSLKDVGAGIKVVPGGRVKGGYVSRDGVIILASDDPPVFVVLAPKLKDGAIIWTCSGMPARLLPGSCRDELQF